MKYIVLIGDGMADHPIPELSNKTPLEISKTPNMDYLAQNGICGWVQNVPRGLKPGSDIANMSIFGYDPKKYFTGRGPFEAASLGIKLDKNDVAFRCNLVAVEKNKMKSFTANHINTKTADHIIKQLNKKIANKKIKFYTGLGYRHLLVIRTASEKEKNIYKQIRCTPPHDITGKNIAEYLPRGKDSKILLDIIKQADEILKKSKSNANMIWPWGQGSLPTVPSFYGLYKLKGAIITAVDLLKGMGITLGLKSINVPGATGYLDTNYLGKAQYALNALKTNDIVFVHVESPDEAGHEGNIKHKIKAIQDFDKYIVGTTLKWARNNSKTKVKILALPDHPTPLDVMTHTSEPVPFAVYANFNELNQSKINGYSEKEIKKSKIYIKNGSQLLKLIISNKLN